MNNPSSALRGASIALLLILTSGCAVTGASLRDAALDTVREPRVWIPLAGAALLQVDDFDGRTSRWARSRTPVFGSTASAGQWSDRLRAVPAVVELGAVVAAPVGTDAGGWLEAKAELGAVDLLAIGSTMLAVKGLKQQTGRWRPDGADRESLPSGHTASAAANGRLAQINLGEVLGERAARWTDAGLDGVEYGTAWARVEAGAHYPSDALVGIALGNFIAAFVHRGLLGEETGVRMSLEPLQGGARLALAARF